MTPMPSPLCVLDSMAEKTLEGYAQLPSANDASSEEKTLDTRLACHIRACCWIA